MNIQEHLNRDKFDFGDISEYPYLTVSSVTEVCEAEIIK